MSSRRIQAMARLIDDIEVKAKEMPCTKGIPCICEILVLIGGYRNEFQSNRSAVTTQKNHDQLLKSLIEEAVWKDFNTTDFRYPHHFEKEIGSEVCKGCGKGRRDRTHTKPPYWGDVPWRPLSETLRKRYIEEFKNHTLKQPEGTKMTPNYNLIELKVKAFVEKDQMFTSVDISNAIKNDGIFIRNVNVAEWLRKNCTDADLFSDYSVTSIALDNGYKANLYHPTHLSADDYKARDQKALTPVEVDKIKDKAMAKVFSAVPAKQVDKHKKKRNPTMGNNFKAAFGGSNKPIKDKNLLTIYGRDKRPTGKEKYLINSTERIKIPAAIIQQLGWHVGDSVNEDKIVTKNAKIPKHLVVNSDHRVSIPRSCVPWGTSPVNVYLENNVVCFEKA